MARVRVSCTIDTTADDSVVLIPESSLAKSTAYFVTVTTDVKSTTDQNLESEFNSQFTTADYDPGFTYSIHLDTTAYSYSLPLLESDTYWGAFEYDFIVFWGDGNSDIINSFDSTNATHVYTEPGDYEVTINGLCECFNTYTFRYNTPITHMIEMIGNCGLKVFSLAFNNTLFTIDSSFNKISLPVSFRDAFVGCSSLIEIPSGLFDNCVDVIDFNGTFWSCTSLVSIPSGLFDNCVHVTDFGSCFRVCESLSTIPEGLFSHCIDATSFDGCFRSCMYLLNTVPTGLFDNCINVTSFHDCFWGCYEITTIPSGLFDDCINVTTFNGCFYNCEHITSLPSGLCDNCTKVEDYRYMFYSCYRMHGLGVPFVNTAEANAAAEGITLQTTECFHQVSGGYWIMEDYASIPIGWK